MLELTLHVYYFVKTRKFNIALVAIYHSGGEK